MFRYLFRLIVIVAILILAFILIFKSFLNEQSGSSVLKAVTNSAVSGLAQYVSANVSDQNNHLEISVSGLSPNSQYHITLDSNSCGSSLIVDVGQAVADSSGYINKTFTLKKIDTNQTWFIDIHQGNSAVGSTLACGQLILNGNSTEQQSAPTSTIADSMLTELEIKTTYPTVMELHHAYPIEMSLIPKSGVRSVSDLASIYTLISASNPTTSVASPTPVGTPNTTMHNAFGKGYEPFATATFYASTFAVQPGLPEEQSLEQPEVSWRWNVTPQETGLQVLSGEIRIDWKSINQKSAVTFSFIVGNPQIAVGVNGSVDWSPWIASGLTVLSGVTLAFLTWLGTQTWSQISKRRKNAKGNEAAKTANEPASKNTDTGNTASTSQHSP